MTTIIPTVFDGKTFVPTTPVDLPVGTPVNVTLPVLDHGYPGPLTGNPNANLTHEEEQLWQETMRAIRSAPADPPTFEEYLREQRGFP